MNGEGGPAKGRPEASAAKPSLPPHYDTDDLTDNIGAQLCRRRGAALRLPPLDCGHRDDLDCLAAEPLPAVSYYCCSSLSLGQAAWLAAAGRFCTETSCARLAAS